jgi:hypothetical protein
LSESRIKGIKKLYGLDTMTELKLQKKKKLYFYKIYAQKNFLLFTYKDGETTKRKRRVHV